MSEGVTDWRDLFCGRVAELQQLEAAYRAVARGQGPRLVVVLGDRGMGKTRLVQELYRRLTTGYDPEDYWPDAALFKGNNLRVAPDLADPQVREHFRRLDVEARVMPFLWWGFRLADPLDRNAVRADLSAHRRTLDPHLGKLLHERRAEAASDRVKDAWWEVGKSAINLGLSALPGIGAGAALAFDGADKAKGGYAAWQGRHLQSMQGAGDVAGIEELAHADLLDQTLSDVAEVLAPTGPIPQVPVVVFCDDAQFARSGGDEGALRLLISLWRRAVDHRWPLMLVASHWAVDWFQHANGASPCFARSFARESTGEHGELLELPREPALSQLAQAGIEGLPSSDVQLLLDKADGNPQILLELVSLVQRSPAWRGRDGGLTSHARARIAEHSTDLTRLILARLNSDITSPEMRRALALASQQGMQFVCELVEDAGQALDLGSMRAGLQSAERPHRMVVGVDEGLGGFVQRAYQEAATSLVGSQIGEPAEVRDRLLRAMRNFLGDDASWRALSADAQVTALGAFVGLGEECADPDINRDIGSALLALTRAMLEREQGSDYPQAAALARRFSEGLGTRFRLRHYSPWQLEAAYDALTVWHGPLSGADLAEAVLERSRALAEESDTPDARRSVSVSLDCVGDVALARGRSKEAEALYRESLALRRELSEELGTPGSRRDVSLSLERVGDVASVQGRTKEAEALYRESLALRRELSEELGTPRSRRDVHVSLCSMGDVAKAQGRWSEAEALYCESLELTRGLSQELGTPGSRRDVSRSLTNVGFVARAQGRWKEAEALYRESLELRRELSEELRTPGARRDVSVSLDRAGDVAAAQGRWKQAEALFVEGLELSRALSEELGTPGSRRDVSVSLDRVGDVALAQGRWKEAEALYVESLELTRALSEEVGTPGSRRDISISIAKVLSTQLPHGVSEEFQPLIEEGLAIRRELWRREPTPDARSELSEMLTLAIAVCVALEQDATALEAELEGLSREPQSTESIPVQRMQRAKALGTQAMQCVEDEPDRASELLVQARELFAGAEASCAAELVVGAVLVIELAQILLDLSVDGATTDWATDLDDLRASIRVRLGADSALAAHFCAQLDTVEAQLEQELGPGEHC